MHEGKLGSIADVVVNGSAPAVKKAAQDWADLCRRDLRQGTVSHRASRQQQCRQCGPAPAGSAAGSPRTREAGDLRLAHELQPFYTPTAHELTPFGSEFLGSAREVS